MVRCPLAGDEGPFSGSAVVENNRMIPAHGVVSVHCSCSEFALLNGDVTKPKTPHRILRIPSWSNPALGPPALVTTMCLSARGISGCADEGATAEEAAERAAAVRLSYSILGIGRGNPCHATVTQRLQTVTGMHG